MKTKDFKKKLTLNKKTVANLSNGQLGHVKGGCVEGTTSCLTRRLTCDTCTCFITCETCVTCVTCGGTCQTCFGQNTCDPDLACIHPTTV